MNNPMLRFNRFVRSLAGGALLLSLGLTPVVLGACDTETTPEIPAAITEGTLTLLGDEGIDFETGLVMIPGNFGTSDVYAVPNGKALQLKVGGSGPIAHRPALWFKPASGPNQVFPSLAAVPSMRPVASDNLPSILYVETGNGFVVATADGGNVKGWVSAANATSMTIEFERLD